MRRVFLFLALVSLLLTACGGTADLTPATPPNATSVEQTGNSQIDTVLTTWRDSVPAAMTQRAIKSETIQQSVYTTAQTLEEVQQYYVSTFEGQNGWTKSPRSPGLQADQGYVIDTYEHGTASLVVGAIDASKFGGEGVVIYTATGHK